MSWCWRCLRTELALCVRSPCFDQSPHRSTGLALSAAQTSQRTALVSATNSSSLSLPHRGTGLALCVRPSVRASASAALTQTLPNFCQLRGLQRLGPERISSAARARPTQVACDRCPGTAPELVAPGSAPGMRPVRFQQRRANEEGRGSAQRHAGSVLRQKPPCPALLKAARVVRSAAPDRGCMSLGRMPGVRQSTSDAALPSSSAPPMESPHW
jgi:hypothetical protein